MTMQRLAEPAAGKIVLTNSEGWGDGKIHGRR